MAKDDDIGANPLVGEMPGDTIANVRAVLSFLQWVKTTKADVLPGERAEFGEYMVLQCCTDALDVMAGVDEHDRAADRGPRAAA